MYVEFPEKLDRPDIFNLPQDKLVLESEREEECGG